MPKPQTPPRRTTSHGVDRVLYQPQLTSPKAMEYESCIVGHFVLLRRWIYKKVSPIRIQRSHKFTPPHKRRYLSCRSLYCTSTTASIPSQPQPRPQRWIYSRSMALPALGKISVSRMVRVVCPATAKQPRRTTASKGASAACWARCETAQ